MPVAWVAINQRWLTVVTTHKPTLPFLVSVVSCSQSLTIYLWLSKDTRCFLSSSDNIFFFWFQMDEELSSNQQLHVQEGICAEEQATAPEGEQLKETKLSGDYSILELTLLEKFISVKLEKLLFKCGLCGQSTVELSQIKQHMSTVHNNDVNVMYTNSLYFSACLSNFQQCVTLLHRTKKCNKDLSVSSMLNKNVASDLNRERPFKCDKCNYTASRLTHLESHMFVHDVRPFKCEHCNHFATRLSYLRTHIKSIHNSLKPFKCEQCSYTALQSCDMKAHFMSVHDREKLYKCGQCTFAASDLSNLKKHMSVHYKVKPFKCDQCSYAAQHMGFLKTHIMYVHNKEKLFKCDECNYAASRQDQLRSHLVNIHSREKPFSCEHCNYSCLRPRDLKRHVLSLHNKQ